MMLHHQLITETGGSEGPRDEGLLDSALNAPFQSFNGTDIFPSVQQKAARLGFGFIRNHAFIDGNKRIGTHAMLVFLSLNGIDLNYTQDELSNLTLKVASGDLSFDDMVQWIIEHQG